MIKKGHAGGGRGAESLKTHILPSCQNQQKCLSLLSASLSLFQLLEAKVDFLSLSSVSSLFVSAYLIHPLASPRPPFFLF